VDSTTPVKVVGLGAVRSFVVGDFHSCAALKTGKVVCWGSNDSGQLGVEDPTVRATPVEVPGIFDAVSLSAGRGHTCAVLSTGAVQCWGVSAGGQLSLPGYIELSPGLPVHYQ